MTEAFFDPTNQQTEAEYFKRMAASHRQQLAPMPEPEPDDYADLAEAAEYMIFNYLTQTSGASVKSEGVSSISSTYIDFEKIREIVRSVMGTYYSPAASLAARYKNPTSYPYPYFPDQSRVFAPDTWSWEIPSSP